MPYGGGAMSQVDGGLARDVAIFEGSIGPGERTGFHAHPGEEHHLVLAGRVRFTQGDTIVEAGPGDYVLLDGTLATTSKSVGGEPPDCSSSMPWGTSDQVERLT